MTVFCVLFDFWRSPRSIINYSPGLIINCRSTADLQPTAVSPIVTPPILIWIPAASHYFAPLVWSAVTSWPNKIKPPVSAVSKFGTSARGETRCSDRRTTVQFHHSCGANHSTVSDSTLLVAELILPKYAIPYESHSKQLNAVVFRDNYSLKTI